TAGDRHRAGAVHPRHAVHLRSRLRQDADAQRDTRRRGGDDGGVVMRGVMRGTVRRPAAGGERGQAMVEFALILIPFFLLVLGILDWGRGIYAANVLSNAAREAARAGIVATRTADQLCGVATRAASPFLPGVTPPAPPVCGAAGAMSALV